MTKKITSKNYVKVLDNFKEWMNNLPKEALKEMCKELNIFFDDLASEDAFGTEAQLDPRGDQRN